MKNYVYMHLKSYAVNVHHRLKAAGQAAGQLVLSMLLEATTLFLTKPSQYI